MAFMAVPTSGGANLSVSGQHGKKEEAPAQPQGAPAAAASAHPASVRAAQARSPQHDSSEGKFGLGIVGAIVGATVVAIIWYFIAVNSFPLRLLASLPGVGAGFLALLLAKRPSQKLGIATAVIAAIVTIATQFAVISGINDRILTRLTEQAYSERLALSKKAADAKTDEQIREIIIQDADSFADSLKLAVAAVTSEKIESGDPNIAKYKATKLPVLIKFAKGDPSRSKFETAARAKFAEDEDNLYQVGGVKLGLMIMWIVSGISSAFKIAAGKEKS